MAYRSTFNVIRVAVIACAASFSWSNVAVSGDSALTHFPVKDAKKGTIPGSPLDQLPEHISLVSDFGMRPAWSPDQTELAFIDAPLGQIHIADLESGEIRNISADIPNFGFLRVHYLSNGDLLVCAPVREVPESDSGPGRFEGVLSVLRAPFDGELQALGPSCWEGIATSRDTMRIGWNRSDVRFDKPGSVDPHSFYSDIWTGEIGYDQNGRAYLFNVKKELDRARAPYNAVLELQDFRGEDDEELILSIYGEEEVNVYGYNTVSKKLIDYSRSNAYEEAEGVAPNGEWMLVERNIESNSRPGALDIWRLTLGSSEWERMTHFNRYRGDKYPFYASNPVVSPKGDMFAFQLSIDGPTEGEGKSILIYRLQSGFK